MVQTSTGACEGMRMVVTYAVHAARIAGLASKPMAWLAHPAYQNVDCSCRMPTHFCDARGLGTTDSIQR